MEYTRNARTVARGLAVTLAISVVGFGFTAGAQNSDPNLHVMVCPRPSDSSINIIHPQSDSITDQPKIEITGAVRYISQIDFFIDDTYNHTQALGISDTEFSSSVTLPPGTHALKFVASDSCSQTTHEQTVIITNEPKVVPSVGNAVNTTVDDKDISGDLAEPVDEQNAFERYVIPPLADIVDFLDLTDEPREGEAGVLLPNAGRAVLFVAGVSFAVSGAYLGSMATLPAHMAFMMPHRRLFLGGMMTAGAAMLGVVFTL